MGKEKPQDGPVTLQAIEEIVERIVHRTMQEDVRRIVRDVVNEVVPPLVRQVIEEVVPSMIIRTVRPMIDEAVSQSANEILTVMAERFDQVDAEMREFKAWLNIRSMKSKDMRCVLKNWN